MTSQVSRNLKIFFIFLNFFCASYHPFLIFEILISTLYINFCDSTPVIVKYASLRPFLFPLSIFFCDNGPVFLWIFGAWPTAIYLESRHTRNRQPVSVHGEVRWWVRYNERAVSCERKRWCKRVLKERLRFSITIITIREMNCTRINIDSQKS